jgi:hypothetical protein
MRAEDVKAAAQRTKAPLRAFVRIQVELEVILSRFG